MGGYACPPSGRSSRRRAAAHHELRSKPGVLLVDGGAGQAPPRTPGKQCAAGIRVCPAVLSALSLCPCTAQHGGRTWQRDSLPSALACRVSQAVQLLGATKTGLNLCISRCPVERKKLNRWGRWCASPCPWKRHPQAEGIFVGHTLEGGPVREPSRTGKDCIAHR